VANGARLVTNVGLREQRLFEHLLLRQPLSLDQLARHLVPGEKPRVHRRHLHRNLARQLPERLVPRDEICLAVELDQRTDPAAAVNIGLDDSLLGSSLGLLGRRLEPLLAQNGLCALHVTLRLDQRPLAIHDAGASFLAQGFDRFCRYFHPAGAPARIVGGMARNALAAAVATSICQVSLTLPRPCAGRGRSRAGRLHLPRDPLRTRTAPRWSVPSPAPAASAPLLPPLPPWHPPRRSHGPRCTHRQCEPSAA